jgi:Tol biopolymer transport system component
MKGARYLAVVRRRGAANGTDGADRSGRRRPARLALVAVTAVALAAGLTACHTRRWQGQLVSANAAGTGSAVDESRYPTLSPDGTKVVFESDAWNLGPTDTNGASDIYVRDLATGVTELVSVNTAGTDSGDAKSYFPQLSPDGTKVAFYSDATNLTSLALRPQGQVYVRDLVAGTTTMVSVNAEGTGGGNDSPGLREFSPDSTRYLFSSRAGDLVPPITEPSSSHFYFERDLTTGVTTRLVETNGQAAYSPSGDALAFFRGSDVYLRDTSTGTIRLVAAGPSGSMLQWLPVFSRDGTKLAFERRTQPAGVRDDIYVYDRVARTTTLVTAGVAGSGGANNSSSPIHGFHPTNPNLLLFSSFASNLVPNDTNGRQDLFVRDLGQRTTVRVASNVGRGFGDDSPTLATWAGNGTKIAFVSWSNGFGGVTDTNGAADVYVRNVGDWTYELVSENVDGHDSGDGDSGRYVYLPGIIDLTQYGISFSADGTRVAFGSYANDLEPLDGDRTRDHDIFVATLGTTGS